MERDIIVHFRKFKNHEKRYMICRLVKSRPWLFYHVTFDPPPFQPKSHRTQIPLTNPEDRYPVLVEPREDVSSFKSVTN